MSAPTIVICQCCDYQFDPSVEECREDTDIGYVCKDCFVQLKWADARLKIAGAKLCSKAFNNRLK